MKSRMMCALITLLVASCSSDDVPHATDTSEEEQAVAAFEELVSEIRERTSTPYEAVFGDADDWEAVHVVVEELDYDVRKTDSLIRPLRGEIRITIGERRYKRTSEDSAIEALLADEEERYVGGTLTVEFNWKDGSWQTEDGSASVFPFAENSPLEDKPNYQHLTADVSRNP